MTEGKPAGFIEGRMVHYVLEEGETLIGSDGKAYRININAIGRHRPAIITHIWNPNVGMASLTVFLDIGDYGREENGVPILFYPATSRYHNEETKAPGTWHYMERTE